MRKQWAIVTRGSAREVYEVMAETSDEALAMIRGGQVEPVVSEVEIDDVVSVSVEEVE